MSTSSTTNKALPLVVDLDGTLTPTDTFFEAALQLAKDSPRRFIGALPLAFSDKAKLKATVVSHTRFSAETLPYNEALLEYLREQKQQGRKLVLATAANEAVANAVANHLGLFDEVLASSSTHNLIGDNKRRALEQQFPDGFSYAGDSNADLAVWPAAESGILVHTSTKTAAAAKNSTSIERQFDRPAIGLHGWRKALRVHQWSKNLLLLVPLLTAYSFTELSSLLATLVAFIAFSLAASANYIVNDLLDIDSDRAHPRKRSRPFASATIPITRGLATSAGLLVIALLLAAAVGLQFFAILCVYLLLTNLYSWSLKAHVLIDVIMLSVLYTIRILAGSAAINVPTSTWLLSFSVFIFLSLALVKRCSELTMLREAGETEAHGRDYRVSDLVVLWPLGVAAALSAVGMFGLFISAPETQLTYNTPDLLWLVSILLIYWSSRLWIKTARGEMHDDPVVYAVKNRGSRYTILMIVAIVIVARFVPIPL